MYLKPLYEGYTLVQWIISSVFHFHFLPQAAFSLPFI
jgi:hypothetical protein